MRCARSQCVAEIMRTSTGIGRTPPTRTTSRSSNSPITGFANPAASHQSHRETEYPDAPLQMNHADRRHDVSRKKTPSSKPNNSDSSQIPVAPQLTATAWRARALRDVSTCAANSLPVRFHESAPWLVNAREQADVYSASFCIKSRFTA